jgi:hypothetical protein
MSKKFTLEEVNEKVKHKSIKILTYESILKPVDAECLICGNKWTTQANVLLNKVCGCPVCNHKKAAKKLSFTKETFMESCGELKSDIEMIGEYTKFQEKTKFHCNTCNYTWETTPYMIKKFKSCPNCTHNRKLTHDEYLERVKKAHGDAYEILSNYEGLSKKIKVKHLKCGNEFETNCLNFIGTGKKPACGCPFCSSLIKSKGENNISDYLTSKNFIFERQYRIKGCKYKKKLPFDFAVFFNEEKTDFCLIEYDGEHHFKYNETGIFTKEKYEGTVRNDSIKDNFCKENKIDLLRISYEDFNNIDSILDNFFSNRSTTIESTQNVEVSRVESNDSKDSDGRNTV